MRSNATAVFFYDQCVGQMNGQMALVPNNPIMFSLARAWRGCDNISEKGFALIISEVADQLDGNTTRTELATFFYDQCTGRTADHMPINPTLYSIISLYGTTHSSYPKGNVKDFATMLTDFAELLAVI